jgi:hypothetical protein
MSENTTQISLRTVLEAINSVGVELHKFREEMREFRENVETRLDDLDERMNVLAGDVVKVRAREGAIRRALQTTSVRESSKRPAKKRV